jgi:hypothetical protein
MATLRLSLDAEITEARRRMALTEIERDAEDYILKKSQRDKEFNEKKQQLMLEAINLVAQKKILNEEYRKGTEYIIQKNKEAFDYYNGRLN